jgi:hypothetical protein
MFRRIASVSLAATLAITALTRAAAANDAAVDSAAVKKFVAAIRANDVASVKSQLQAQP